MLRPALPRRAALRLMLGTVVLPAAARAADALPRHDLFVELRAVGASAGSGSAWDLSSADIARDRIVAQRVRVSNGQSASLSLAVARPVQTWQVLPGVWRGVVAPATQWITARQTLVVQPRWPGGTQPVALTLRTAAAHLDPAVAPGSAEPPQRREAEIETIVELALGAWVVIATSGDLDAASGRGIGTAGTRDSAASHALQLRVSLAT
jgi:hypothetical protein